MVWMIPVILLLLEVALLSVNIALSLSVKKDIRERMKTAQREYDEFCGWFDSLTEKEQQSLISKYESEESANHKIRNLNYNTDGGCRQDKSKGEHNG